MKNLQKETWELKPLGEISEIYSGNNKVTGDTKNTGNFPAVKSGDISSLAGNIFYECKTFVDPVLVKATKTFESGTVVMISQSGSPQVIGRTFLYLGKEKFIPGTGIYVLKHNQNPSYMLHSLSSTTIASKIKEIAYKRYTKGMPMRIGKDELKNLKIPVPSLNIQSSVANFLNKFSELIEELKETLIESKKQYSYYLNSLIGRSEEEVWLRN